MMARCPSPVCGHTLVEVAEGATRTFLPHRRDPKQPDLCVFSGSPVFDDQLVKETSR